MTRPAPGLLQTLEQIPDPRPDLKRRLRLDNIRAVIREHALKLDALFPRLGVGNVSGSLMLQVGLP